MAWSPDGEHIVFASTRMGFKDEATYTDAPQPYGEIFVMRADGIGCSAADRQPVGRRDAGVAAGATSGDGQVNEPCRRKSLEEA